MIWSQFNSFFIFIPGYSWPHVQHPRCVDWVILCLIFPLCMFSYTVSSARPTLPPHGTHRHNPSFSWATDTCFSFKVFSCYFSLILSLSPSGPGFGSGLASLELKLSHLPMRTSVHQAVLDCVLLLHPWTIQHPWKIATINGDIHYRILRSISYLLLHNKLTYI